ncbi:hypothetical protein XF36_28810 (plasmid) [Pseudonocardia sp. HH130629-09]|nr:hypothetical protein XF36_28810 [Pseudonocardia sp. HH130629-09]
MARPDRRRRSGRRAHHPRVVAGQPGHPDGTRTRSPRSARPPRERPGAAPVADETSEQRLARLEAENKALRTEKTKLETEREILRQAAKYFAGETNW